MNVERSVVWTAAAACALLIVAWTASAAMAGGVLLTLPFDFSHQQIGLSVSLNGTPLFALLDTGVDPRRDARRCRRSAQPVSFRP
jgi:hypothetical protein